MKKSISYMGEICRLFILLLVCFCLGKGNVEAAGENLSNAISVDTGKFFSGKFDDSYDEEQCYYKFKLKQNSIIKLYVETGSHSQDMTLTLRDSKGNSLPNKGSYLTTRDDNNWGYQSASCKIALNKGTYYLQASNYDWNDVYYKIKVTVLTKATSNVKIAGCENNYRNKALSFNVGDKLTSVAQSNYYNHFENEQHYKFKVNSARTVILNFSTEINKHKNRFYIDVCDSKGKKIESCDIVGKDGENKSSFKKHLKKGTYYICVETYSDHEPTYTIKTAYKPYATKVTNLTSKNKSITVKWKEKSGITGYQIQYSQNSNFNNAKKVKVSADNVSRKIKGLKAGKKYYVRVRTYKTAFSSTYYSDWSAKKSIKVKK